MDDTHPTDVGAGPSGTKAELIAEPESRHGKPKGNVVNGVDKKVKSTKDRDKDDEKKKPRKKVKKASAQLDDDGSESDSDSSDSDSSSDSFSSDSESESESESESDVEREVRKKGGTKKRSASHRDNKKKKDKKSKSKKSRKPIGSEYSASDDSGDNSDAGSHRGRRRADDAINPADIGGLRLQMQLLTDALNSNTLGQQRATPGVSAPWMAPPPPSMAPPPLLVPPPRPLNDGWGSGPGGGGLRLNQINNPIIPSGGRRRPRRILRDGNPNGFLLGSGNDDGGRGGGDSDGEPFLNGISINDNNRSRSRHGRGGRRKRMRLEFKRVDQVWDRRIHNYKLQETAEMAMDAHYDEFLFHVRRTFDWEGKYKATVIDIKSKLLRDSLQEVIGSVKGISLVDDTPKLDPNLLFLYLDDFKAHYKALKKRKPSAEFKSTRDRKKEQKKILGRRQQLKVLIRYLNKDYAQIKNSLYPMLKNGLITFDLLWALWKPNTLAYTTTYGSQDEARIYKVEIAEKNYSMMRGDFYYVDGKYFEFDGKQFGHGSISEEIAEFRGARKITSLPVYPLKYHKNEAEIRKTLIERGKKFVALGGVHYKSHQGMAYYKKKNSIVKVNINGRVMVDPSIHRRINPNYPISHVRPKEHDLLDGSDNGLVGIGASYFSGSESDGGGAAGGTDVALDELDGEEPKYATKVIKGPDGSVLPIIIKNEPREGQQEKLDKVTPKKVNADDGDDGDGDGDGDTADANTPTESTDAGNNAAEGGKDGKDSKDKAKPPPEFSEEEYLIASPVVLGFAFAEKLWLEFTVSGINEINWNEQAYESLVLEPKTKDIVKALVESHKYHAAESIDDVIQGKGKGLVAVLHGPPGTGKTLTAEGISELLKCPLYMVSAGELGTDSRYLELELQKILDICHAWGAILLLDEADVFLEKRNMHDIHRNALVSIFLRQLEYFQGILFLTTNRVETFDDAFQSRIHIALRYDSLDLKAKKAIFKIFIERVRCLEQIDLMPFTEEDYLTLARHDLNGRQIKNTVRTAQALAVNKGEPLSMSHIRQVLEVHVNFDRDLKGGTGYQDAMRGYM